MELVEYMDTVYEIMIVLAFVQQPTKTGTTKWRTWTRSIFGCASIKAQVVSAYDGMVLVRYSYFIIKIYAFILSRSLSDICL